MSTLVSILIIIASILLVLLVFIQNPKGGGLSSDFGAANQLGGVQKTNDFVDKATWSLAGVIAVCSIILTIYMTPKVERVQENTANTEQAEMPAGDLPDAQ